MSQELENEVLAYKELSKQIDLLTEKRKMLGNEILQKLSRDSKTFQIAGYRVQRCSRFSIKTSIEDAKVYGATKMQEVLDKDEIKRLYEMGEPIPDVQKFEMIAISNAKAL